MNDVRVRFAPSPTGYLHIGGARTALFNWLFARNMKGKFILRIEDTDEVRSTAQSVGAIIESMKWLGLDWDEGPTQIEDKVSDDKRFLISGRNYLGNCPPYFQMEAKEKGIYQEFVDKLITQDKVYPCYCTNEDVETMRQKAQAKKQIPKYDGTCRKLTNLERDQKKAKGLPSVIRFKMPDEGSVSFDDIVRGYVSFENAVLDDFVIMKANGVPTYNFACVVDDFRMQISHVIRGDDHLSNTPKQIHLYNALGFQLPKFAHLSMILGSDGSRLSKRHGHTSVLEYRSDGYLPGALVNYLALLGWSTTESQQLFKLDELIKKFSLERCSKNPAVFDNQKLQWMNGEYIRQLSPENLKENFYSWLGKNPEVQAKISSWDRNLIDRLIVMEQEKIKLLKDIPGLIDIFFVDAVEYQPEAVEKVLKKDSAKMVLEENLKNLGGLNDFNADTLEKYARDFAAQKTLGTGKVFHPLRVAVSGRTQGPSLFHMMEILGKEKTLKRINECLMKCF
ncbi:MAG: glutamate--tRNA ligase [Elusimicrobia bacterium]|nr:glutamate--tRNA ligase [Candidatus Liberimonas magnetica]